LYPKNAKVIVSVLIEQNVYAWVRQTAR
jgi:hypothetical protein